MRVAIDGTQSTGKTTLLTALREEHLGDFIFLNEAARRLAPQVGISVTEDWAALFESPSRHLEFLRRLFAYQSSLEAEARHFMVDGSLYKILAYALTFGFAVDDVTASTNEISYDLIVYCPPNIAFQDDGFRYQENRDELAARLEQLYDRLYGGRLMIASGSTRERVEQVHSALHQSNPQEF
jgi:nicotinamide riboside kinase